MVYFHFLQGLGLQYVAKYRCYCKLGPYNKVDNITGTYEFQNITGTHSMSCILYSGMGYMISKI
jgi:hypothetical protein